MDAKRLLNELCKYLEQDINKDNGSRWVHVGLKVYHKPLGNFRFSDHEYYAEIWIDNIIYVKESITNKKMKDAINLENEACHRLLRKVFSSGVLGYCNRRHVKTAKERWQGIILALKRFYY